MKIVQISDLEGNRAYAKTHADDASVEGLSTFVKTAVKEYIDENYYTKEEVDQAIKTAMKGGAS